MGVVELQIAREVDLCLVGLGSLHGEVEDRVIEGLALAPYVDHRVHVLGGSGHHLVQVPYKKLKSPRLPKLVSEDDV